MSTRWSVPVRFRAARLAVALVVLLTAVAAAPVPRSLARSSANLTVLSPYVWDEFWFGDRWINYAASTEGVAVDRAGRVYASSVGNSRIARYRADGSRELSWGTRGSNLGQLWFPRDLALDGDGNVYVADTANNRVQKFSPTGTPLMVFGIKGSGDGQLSVPRGVAVGLEGRVYVADSGNHRVEVFSAKGAFLQTIGQQGSAPGQFNLPSGLGADAAGNIYVADTLNDRVQVLSPLGSVLRVFGGRGTGAGKFYNPADVTPGLGATVFVADDGNRKIQWLTADGVFKAEFAGPTDPTGYTDTNAASVAVDAAGCVYVADPDDDAIDRFTPRGAKVVLAKPALLTKYPRAGRSFEVSASARPVHKSTADRIYWELRKSGSSRVTKIKPDRRYLGGRWVFYKKAFRLTAGTYTVRAVSPADAEHGLTTTAYLKFTVRR